VLLAGTGVPRSLFIAIAEGPVLLMELIAIIGIDVEVLDMVVITMLLPGEVKLAFDGRLK